MSQRDKRERKKKRRQERLRQMKHLAHSQGLPFGPPSEGGDDVGGDDYLEDDVSAEEPLKDEDFDEEEDEGDQGGPYEEERFLRRRARALPKEREPTSEELEASNLEEMARAVMGDMSLDDEDPKEQAQELAFQAMEADDPFQAVRLAREALTHDPECTDALALRAELTATSQAQLCRELADIVALAERLLGGKEFFDANKGLFWGAVLTRPYMRARTALAAALIRDGRTEEAIPHIEALLELDREDNQASHTFLLGCYLETLNLEGARRLLKQFEKDTSASFAYGRALERFLSGEPAEAEALLLQAVEANKYVVAALLGGMPVGAMPKTYKFGSTSEAMVVWAEQRRAWRTRPEALYWLESRIPLLEPLLR